MEKFRSTSYCKSNVVLIKLKSLAVGEIHFNDGSFTKYSEISGVCMLVFILTCTFVLINAQYFFYYQKNIIKLLFLIINYKINFISSITIVTLSLYLNITQVSKLSFIIS